MVSSILGFNEGAVSRFNVHVTDDKGREVEHGPKSEKGQISFGLSLTGDTPAPSSELQSFANVTSQLEQTVTTLDSLTRSVSDFSNQGRGNSPNARQESPPGISVALSRAQSAWLSSAPVVTTTAATSQTTATSGGNSTSTAGAASTSATSTGSAIGGTSATGQAGTDATVADFGSITINGVATYLGSVQAPYMTSEDAATYIAGAINSNDKNTVTASINDSGALVLTSKDGTSPITIDAVGGSTTGNESQLTSIGFSTGTYGSTVTADSAISSPLFAENFASYYSGTAGTSGSSSTTTSGTSSTVSTSSTSAAISQATASTVSSTTTWSHGTPKGLLRKG